MVLFGLKNCDTCRKAQKALAEAGHAVDFVDVRDTPLSDDRRATFLAAFGDRLVNTRSTTWRGLSEAERAQAPDTLLAVHPTLMKRPVIADGETLYLGWDATVKSALL